MSTEEQSISPEEKLLKVIKGETPAAPAGTVPVAASVAPPPAVAAQAPKPAPPPAVVPQAPRPAAVAAPVTAQAPVKPPVPAAQPAPRPLSPPPKPPPAAAAAQVPQPPSALPKSAAAVPKMQAKPAPEVPKAPAQAATAEKPKLKVAKTDAADGKSAPPVKSEPAPAAVLAAPAPAVHSPAFSAKKRTDERKFGVRRINYGLAAAVFVLLAFSVNEILAKMRSDSVLHKSVINSGSGGSSLPVQATTGSGLPSLEVIMQWLGDRPIVAKADQKLPPEKTGGGDGGGGTVQVADWMKYVQDNIKLMGFSGDTVSSWQEAILQESKDGKLIYVKAGGKISIPGQDIQVEAVKDDQVFLTDGRRKMTLK